MGKQNVLRFQITVDDPLGMCIFNGLCDLTHDPRSFFRSEWTVPQHLAETLAVDKTHRIKMASLMLANLEYRNDVGMVQRGRCGCLGFESLDFLSRGKVPAENHLQGDCAVRFDLSRLINDPHSTPGDLLQQLVAAETSQW